jgi:hypothetical protein
LYTIAIFKSFIRQHNYPGKTCRYVNDHLLTKLNSSKCSDLEVVSIYTIWISSSTFLHFFGQKWSIVVQPFKTYQHTTFHGPTLTAACLCSPQNFECPQFWNVEVMKLWPWGHLSGLTSLLNFIKRTIWFKSYWEGSTQWTGRQPDGMVIS